MPPCGGALRNFGIFRRQFMRLWRQTGRVDPRPRGDLRHGKLVPLRDFILAAVAARDDITMLELAGTAAIMREQRQRLVFIDETGTTTKMTRLRGRSTKGTRLNSKAPFGHWGTQTFVVGLKCDGLIAPWVIDAPMNRVIFETYVETQLAPALEPGDVVIFDNLSNH